MTSKDFKDFIGKNLFWVVLGAITIISIVLLIIALPNTESSNSAGVFIKIAFAGLIFGAVKSRENSKIAAALVGTAIFVLLIIIGKFDTFFSSSSSGINNMIWVAMIGGLVWAAVVSREKPYLAWTLAGLSTLVFLVLLGKFVVLFTKIETIFGWTVLGLPIFAAAGFYGSTKIEGGAKTFLGFASGVAVLFWMYMFYQDSTQIKGLGFFDETIPVLFPDATAKTIFVVFAGLVGLALWKKSKIFGILSIFVFLSFLGNTLVNEMIERFPKKLTPVSATGIGEKGAKLIDKIFQDPPTSRERWIKKGVKLYKYNGTFAANSVVEKESVKVFLLGEQVEKDGLTFEKVRLEDPAIGEEFWVYAGELITPQNTSDSRTNSTEKAGRELVGSFPIFLSSNSFNRWSGKNGERKGTGEVFIPHMCEMGYEYFFKVSGEFEKLFWHPPFEKISWQGNDAVAGQGANKPFPNLRYGALALRIGDKQGVFPSGADGEIKAMIIAPTPIFAEVNINREIGEYLDTQNNQGGKLQNSTLSVKIERRRLIE
jgi:hypothetical protein